MGWASYQEDNLDARAESIRRGRSKPYVPNRKSKAKPFKRENVRSSLHGQTGGSKQLTPSNQSFNHRPHGKRKVRRKSVSSWWFDSHKLPGRRKSVSRRHRGRQKKSPNQLTIDFNG